MLHVTCRAHIVTSVSVQHVQYLLLVTLKKILLTYMYNTHREIKIAIIILIQSSVLPCLSFSTGLLLGIVV